MKKLLILPLLVFAACSDNIQIDNTTGVQNVSNTVANADSLPAGASAAGAKANQAAGTAASPLTMPELQQEPIAEKVVVNVKPKREGQFHFEGTEVSDAQLSEFYVEVDASIDGKSVGTMTFVFWPEKAPITVRNFLRYCDEGFYDGKIYHRILREFMIQGGSSDNTAAGKGPNGTIKGEFSNDPQWAHRYGVLSMARGGDPDSASGQYFVITDSESPSVHALDGKYASFGIMVHGVKTLEAIAEVKTKANPMSGEPSQPLQRAIVDTVRVMRGTPSVSEAIKRPAFDLHGEAERVKIQHILISFAGTGTEATRTKEEAEALAKDILAQAQNGADFDALVRSNTDDPGSVASTPPGSYPLLNNRQKAPGEDLVMALQTKLLAEVEAETKTMEAAKAEFMASEVFKSFSATRWMPRGQMVSGFGDTAFSLQVGEIGICNFDPAASKFGWHIIKRYE
mgnify:CR=1 FL=1|jgi:peptidyl-prolyl cis-trans isomerase B (cyclophilin B)